MAKKYFILLIFGALVLTIGYMGSINKKQYKNIDSKELSTTSDPTSYSEPGALIDIEKHDLVEPIDDSLLLEYQNYQSLFKSRERFREFFENVDQLDDVTKQQELAELNEEVDSLNQQQRISDAESLMMKLALLKLYPDSEQAKQISLALVQKYRAISDARLQFYIDNPDPQFKDYKQRESEVVREVMDMSVYPDGLTRDQYLAKRLAEIRKQVYKSDEG